MPQQLFTPAQAHIQPTAQSLFLAVLFQSLAAISDTK